MDKYLTNDNVDTLFIRKRNKENKDRQVEWGRNKFEVWH